MENLKRCPICGGKAVFVKKTNTSNHYCAGFDFEIECKRCKLKLPKRYSVRFSLTEDGTVTMCQDEREQAVKKWNKRMQ